MLDHEKVCWTEDLPSKKREILTKTTLLLALSHSNFANSPSIAQTGMLPTECVCFFFCMHFPCLGWLLVFIYLSPLWDVLPDQTSQGSCFFPLLLLVHTDTCLTTTDICYLAYAALDAPQSYPFLPYHPIRVYKVVSTYAELQFNKLMRLVPLFGHFARFQLTNSKKTDVIK